MASHNYDPMQNGWKRTNTARRIKKRFSVMTVTITKAHPQRITSVTFIDSATSSKAKALANWLDRVQKLRYKSKQQPCLAEKLDMQWLEFCNQNNIILDKPQPQLPFCLVEAVARLERSLLDDVAYQRPQPISTQTYINALDASLSYARLGAADNGAGGVGVRLTLTTEQARLLGDVLRAFHGQPTVHNQDDTECLCVDASQPKRKKDRS